MAIYNRIKLTLEDGDFVGNTVLFDKQDGGMSLSSQNTPPALPDVVYLTPNEINQLRALITPPVTDKQIDALLIAINDVAVETDHTIYGLPIYTTDTDQLNKFRKAVQDWLNDLNQFKTSKE